MHEIDGGVIEQSVKISLREYGSHYTTKFDIFGYEFCISLKFFKAILYMFITCMIYRYFYLFENAYKKFSVQRLHF
jgi:hypothetical protein